MVRSFPVGKVPLAIIAMGVVLAALLLLGPALATTPPVPIPQPGSHEVDRHQGEIVTLTGVTVISAATNCFGGAGTISQTPYFNHQNGHVAWLCQDEDGLFIWIIDTLDRTVTMFKNKAKTFDAAAHYLANRGYQP